MSIVTRKIYGTDGYRRNEADAWFVYTAFADLDDGYVIVKVGISTKPYERLVNVHSNSPFGVDLAAFAVVGSKRRALACERRILEEFAQYKTRGEWLKLPRNAETKAKFAECVRLVVKGQTGADFKWRRVTREQIVATISTRLLNL
jgi:hypothetical protein